MNVLETKVAVFMLSAGIAGFAGAFLAQYYETLNQAQFSMLGGLPLVLALVIGGVGIVAGALFAGIFGLGLIILQETWHLSLWPRDRVPRARPRRARHHPEPVGRGRADRRRLRAAAAVAQGRARPRPRR